MIQAFFNRVDESRVDRIRDWMLELKRRQKEVLETFENERTTHERVVLIPPQPDFIMVHSIERDDPVAGRAAFLSSQLPIDVEHRAMMDEVTLGPALTETLFELSLESPPS